MRGKELHVEPWEVWGGTNCSKLAFLITNTENQISKQVINLRGVRVLQVGGQGGRTGWDSGH